MGNKGRYYCRARKAQSMKTLDEVGKGLLLECRRECIISSDVKFAIQKYHKAAMWEKNWSGRKLEAETLAKRLLKQSQARTIWP
jgi:hypothetical protein